MYGIDIWSRLNLFNFQFFSGVGGTENIIKVSNNVSWKSMCVENGTKPGDIMWLYTIFILAFLLPSYNPCTAKEEYRCQVIN